ncbi:MBL fold metallo-hydrolase, partial [Candidatus Micrarchaeota archaeon]|nr:MBL fold metallo-hydrolase [Candidatus Micrarchaeota archaeon]
MPSIAIKYESELILWDCGEGTQRQLMKYKVGYGSIDHIMISHPHLDHYLGLFGLLETLRLSSPAPRPVNLFVPKQLDLQDYKFAKLSKLKNGLIYRGKNFTISAFPVKHTKNSFGLVFQEDDKIKFHEEKAHSLGVHGKLFKEIQKKGKIKTDKGEIKLQDITWKNPGKKIVYSGDCSFDDNVLEAARGADILIHEATFDSSKKQEATERSHSTAEDAAMVAKKAKVKQLILTHISPR